MIPEAGTPPPRVLIVGASLAGCTVATELRRYDFAGEILLIGAEPEPPYERPPLSKAALTRGEGEAELSLASAAELARLEIDWRGDAAAKALDVSGNAVELAGGERLDYDVLVIATGAEPRRLPSAGAGEVHYLRTAADARALRADLLGAESVAVVGGGFIGCEVAASAAQLGKRATIVEMGRSLMEKGLGYSPMSTTCLQLHLDHGVAVELGATVLGIDRDGLRYRVALSGGADLEVDAVVVGIGVEPAVAWLEGSGLELDDGVVCDVDGRAAARVYAAGDVARRFDPSRGEHVRGEHWTGALAEAKAVARTILHHAPAPLPLPYVWSDQHGVRLQVVGDFADAEVFERESDGDGRGRTLVMGYRDGRLAGAAGLGASGRIAGLRIELEAARRRLEIA